MKECNKVFFGEHGITATSANYLANLAQELIVKDEEELEAADYVTVTGTIISSDGAPKCFSEGKDELWVKEQENILNRIAEANSYCAWMREAIKAKESEEEYWNNYEFDCWIRDVKKIPYPKCESAKRVDTSDIINEMNVKERQEYLSLEAIASTYGKFIHPRKVVLGKVYGTLNEARKQLHQKLAKPSYVTGEGMNTIVYSITAAAKPEIVDNVFNRLQDYHRSIEQRLNKIKGQINSEVNKRNIAANHLNVKYIEEYQSTISSLREEFGIYVKERLAEVAALKIVVPEKLQEFHDKLNAIGKPE